MTPSPFVQYGADAVFILLAGGSAFVTWLGGRRQTRSLDTLDANSDRRIAEVRAQIIEVRDFVVGPDGQNGIRGELRAFKGEVIKRLDGLEARERERLEARDVGTYRLPR